MIQVYAGGLLAYDSRLSEYKLKALNVTTGVNKGGTATIAMPPQHPAIDAFDAYKTIVEIYRDGLLKFRGRALYPTDDFYNNRTVLCEGERCFFQDAVCRPYLNQDNPAAIFAAVVGIYNSQVEEAKQFKVGTVTVTDANDYIRMESESAEKCSAIIDKLQERCGGYITFTTDSTDGKRVINWLASLDYRSGQVIEFGENLLSYAKSGANTNLITAVLPYGAKDEETGQRVTIESVNGGVDYIQDDEAVALRGFIIEPVIWDDVTNPTNLLRKAQQYLEGRRYIINSLQLTALDLSYVDKSVDSFQVGDTIRVVSRPHNVDDDFLLTDRTEDLLSPANSSITLGKDISTLTDADVAGDRQNQEGLYKVTHQVKADYLLNIAKAVEQMETTMSSLISQTSQSIMQEVSKTYTTNDQLTAAVSTSLEQTAESFTFSFNELKAVVDAADAEMREHIVEQSSYIRLEDGKIILEANAMQLTLENGLIIFKKNGKQFGWWDGVDFHTGNIVVEVNERAQFGNFAFIPRTNGSLSFLKVGESGVVPGRTLNITTTCWSNSGYSSITLYINGVAQYTTPEHGDSGTDIVYTDTFNNVTEAYIVFEESFSSSANTEVNGVKVWSSADEVGAQYDLLTLGTDNIQIRTDFNY